MKTKNTLKNKRKYKNTTKTTKTKRSSIKKNFRNFNPSIIHPASLSSSYKVTKQSLYDPAITHPASLKT